MKIRVLPGCCTVAHLYQLPNDYAYGWQSPLYFKKQLKTAIQKRKQAGFKIIEAFVVKKADYSVHQQSKIYNLLIKEGFQDLQTLKPTTRHIEDEVHLLTLQLADWKEK